MSDFTVSESLPASETWGVSAAASGGTVVTGAGANAWGSWTELKSSTGIAATFLIVTAADPNGGNQIDVDIGVGASGSEVTVVQALFLRSDGNLRNTSAVYALPIAIPSGSRVSARIRGATASRTARVTIQAFAGASPISSFRGLDSIGGAYIATNGYTNNTKGGWTQIVAATTRAYRAIHVAWGLIDFVSGQTSMMLLDVGLGASGSEVVVVPDLYTTAANVSAVTHNQTPNAFIPGGIPAGTRVAVRGQVTAGNASRYMTAFVYGYY